MPFNWTTHYTAGNVTGFVYPNEVINWQILIVIYPYITGLVAGAFITSALYHVFGKEELKPVSRLALLLSACLLVATPLPLLVHLASPERAFFIFITPNFTSAMGGFGYIYAAYFLIVLLEIFFVYRLTFIDYAEAGKGIKGAIGKLLAFLGTGDRSAQARALDHRIVYGLAIVGIPAASLLHGYAGFIFGSVKANQYWANPLTPIIFLLSAIVSGIALLMLVYPVAAWLSRKTVDMKAMHSMGEALWYFFAVDLVLHFVVYAYMDYTNFEAWHSIEHVLHEKLAFSYIWGEWILGGIVPWLLLSYPKVGKVGLKRGMLAAALFQFGIFAMRWDVVIGGQLFSRSLAGFLSYSPPLFWTRESIVVALMLTALPFVLLPIVNRLLPWEVPRGEKH